VAHEQHIKQKIQSNKYSARFKWWSTRVNLWDTFAWKKDKALPNTWKTIGQKFGAIDKMYDSEKDLFKVNLVSQITGRTVKHKKIIQNKVFVS